MHKTSSMHLMNTVQQSVAVPPHAHIIELTNHTPAKYYLYNMHPANSAYINDIEEDDAMLQRDRK